MSAPRSLAERCLAIDMLIVDVDGVLTEGGIAYGDTGLELKTFHVRDGSGLKIWEHVGKRAALITGRSSPVVARRAEELALRPAIQGVRDKLPSYRQLLVDGALRMEQVCFVGDDIPDLPILLNCGLAVAVADAAPEVRAEAHYVTHARGGRGAVREAIELILRCQGVWQELVVRFRNERL